MQQRASARGKLVVGNWKMNGSLESNAALLDAIAGSNGSCEAAVCVPAPYLAQVAGRLESSRLAWGSQDVSEHESGAYTGETSAAMLEDFDCRYAIVGHSERRTLFGDTDERVAAKTERAIGAGLVPIVCVGETLAEREQGKAAQVVKRQLDAVIDRVGVAGLGKSIVAYEPVWAIGTGKTASPEEAQAMHAMIRAHVAMRDGAVAAGLKVIYGGSVKASNAKALFAGEDIDGGLIGGASLVASDFLAIVDAASAS